MNEIEKYLLRKKTNNTKRAYKGRLERYFLFLIGNQDLIDYANKKLKRTKIPKEKQIEIDDAVNEFITSYLKNKHEYADDLFKYANYLSKKKLPLTVKSNINTIIKFLRVNKIIIDEEDLNDIKNKTKAYPQTIDKAPTKSELKQILSHGTSKDRALFLTLCSSGIRIGEALNIKLQDIEFNSNPTKITIRGEHAKGERPRIIFISDEAKLAIKEWLKERDRYILNATKKYNFGNKKDLPQAESRLFPFSNTTAHHMWVRILIKAGYDKKDPTSGILIMHTHTLRKFFRTNMPSNEISVDMVEELMGHSGYLTRSYLRFNEEQIAEAYRKGMHNVTIFELPMDAERIELLEAQNKIFKKELNDMKNMIKGLDSDMITLLYRKLSDEEREKLLEARGSRFVKTTTSEEDKQIRKRYMSDDNFNEIKEPTEIEQRKIAKKINKKKNSRN